MKGVSLEVENESFGLVDDDDDEIELKEFDTGNDEVVDDDGVKIKLDELDDDEDDGDGDDVRFVAAAADKKKAATSSIPFASANFINSILGAGVLGMPFAFAEAGLGLGMILLFVSFLLTDYTIRLIIRLGVDHGKQTYEKLCEHAFGPAGSMLVGFFMFVFVIGAMTSYVTILGNIGPLILRHWVPPDSFWGTRSFFILANCLLIFLPLSLLRQVAHLSRFSALATVSILAVMGAVFSNSPFVGATPWPADVGPFASTNFFPAIGIFAGAFVCHHNAFLIFASLSNATVKRWTVTSHLSVGFSYAVLLITALSGYLTYGQDVEGNIFINLPDNLAVNICRLCAGIVLSLTYPLEAMVGRSVITGLLFKTKWGRRRCGHQATESSPLRLSWPAHFLITGLIVLVTTLLGWLAGDETGVVFELVGGFAAVSIAYVIPAALALKLDSRKRSPALFWKLFVLVFGLVAMVASTVKTISNIIEKASSSAGDDM